MLCYRQISEENYTKLQNLAKKKTGIPPLQYYAIRNLFLGLSVFPLGVNSKRPRIKWEGFQTRFPTTLEIQEWFGGKYRGKPKNIGIATGYHSGVVVLDGDNEEACEFIEKNLPPTPWVVITTKGKHYYYRYPDVSEQPIGNRTKITLLGTKLTADIRGDGGYCVAPPSFHDRQKEFQYREVEPFENFRKEDLPPFDPNWLTIINDESELAPENGTGNDPFPESEEDQALDYEGCEGAEILACDGAEILASIEREEVLAAAKEHLKQCLPAIEGQSGDETTYRVTCDLVRGFNLDNNTALQLLLDHYNPRCKPSWSEKNLLIKVESARKSGKGVFGYLLARVRSAPHGEVQPLPPLEPWVPGAPLLLVPEPFRDFVADNHERSQMKIECLAATLITVLAGTINKQFLVRPKRNDAGFVFPISTWGAIVQASGKKKSKVMDLGMHFPRKVQLTLDETNRDNAIEFSAFLNSYEAQKAFLKEEIKRARAGKIPRPLQELFEELKKLEEEKSCKEKECYEKFIWVNETTVAMLQRDLEYNRKGMLIFRDELTGWIKILERPENAGDKQFYLEGLGAPNAVYSKRTKNAGSGSSSPCFSIFGGIQPEVAKHLVEDYITSGDDGFLARFSMLVFPSADDEARWVDKQMDLAAQSQILEIFQKIFDAKGILFEQPDKPDGLGIELQFDDAASKFYSEWYVRHETRVFSSDLPGLLQSHLCKYHHLVAALSGLFHLIEWADGKVNTKPNLIRSHNVALAIAWAQYLELSANRLYAQAGAPALSVAHELAKRILNGDITDGTSVREIYQNHWAQLSDAKTVKRGLSALQALGWLTVKPVGTKGRSGEIVTFNPKLKDMEFLKALIEKPQGEKVFQSEWVQRAEELRLKEIEEALAYAI